MKLNITHGIWTHTRQSHSAFCPVDRHIYDAFKDRGSVGVYSTLTIRILKNRYLAHVQGDTLSPEAKSFMKQVVQEEILKMQDFDNTESDAENQKAQKKRKRTDELFSEEKNEFVAKKSRQSPSLLESENKANSFTTIEDKKTEAPSHSGSDNKKHLMNKSHRQIKAESTDEEEIGIKSERLGGDSPEVEESKANTLKDSGTARKIQSHEKKTTQSDKDSDGDDVSDSIDEKENSIESERMSGGSPEVEESKATTLKDSSTARKIQSHEKETTQSDEGSDEDDVSEKSQKIKNHTSSDDGEKEKPSEKKIKDETDSDSSSLPSLDDEDDKRRGNAQEKKKTEGKKDSEETKKSGKGGQKDEHKSVVRLKRFISLCGVRRNYKKLLHGCRSVRSQVTVLKKELEDLGVHGKPSVERCKKIRMKREEAQELAELDVNNIISTQGRPKRRAASVWQEQQETPSSTYTRPLRSSSDSDDENKINTGRRRTTDWNNLQGIISDDADSD